MTVFRSLFLVSLLAAGGVGTAVAAAPPPVAAADPQAAEFFETQVRPVLAEHCYPCHGPAAQQSALRLDSLAALLKGSSSGHIVLAPGSPEGSALIHVIQYSGDIKMPPSGKLGDKDIAALSAWVKMGAPWPASTQAAPTAKSDSWKTHWAFQPVKLPAIPAVKNKAWVQSPVDAFILSKLEEKGLSPAPPADRPTLLRRASYDLTGLPPTPAEVDAFLQDKAPGAWSRVVDRLLASPRYGERWGRFWLDVARYSDTKGYTFNEDRAYPFAYTYRDWVIRALNDDMPYDQFLKEQIAADLLPQTADKRTLAALGFLTVGRRFLNQQPDIIDDRIDVVSRGMMGLTVGCARCHDHKFDPIPTKDYYSLYGVFASSQEPKELPMIAAHAKIEAYQIYDTELKSRQDAAAKFQETNKKALMMGDATLKTQLATLQSRVDDWKKTAPPEPERAMVMEDAPTPVEPVVFKRGNPNNPGDKVPRQFLEILSGSDRKPFQHGSGRLELADAVANGANPLTARVMVNRIWLHHFGSGLVRTPSDFGMRSDPPTHPELLDYLAERFLQDGWSIKKVHRLILLSSVYEESSDGSSVARLKDPENLLLAHMNRQRLDFEALHDSLLAASARLDSTAGGPAVDIVTAPFSPRRAVYGSIDRQNLPSLFRTFDFANPDMHSPQRHVTTVPQQALFMMNSPFVVEQAQRLAARPEVASAGDGASRIARLYRLLFGRPSTQREVQLGLRYLSLTSLPLPGSGPDESTSAAWQYGYGEYDEASGRVKTFQPLGHWTGMVWQVGDVFPDPKLGYLLLNPGGGHPGNDLQHAIIRRWTAPADGVVTISGTLNHGQTEGDGVQGRIVSSRLGDLGHWLAHHSAAETNVPSAAVTRGDTIDFVLDCRTGPNSDSFGWAPVVRLTPKGPGTDITAKEWNASNDFSGPPATSQKPLGPWEKYAQVLLMTNEFAFVD